MACCRAIRDYGKKKVQGKAVDVSVDLDVDEKCCIEKQSKLPP